MPTNSREYMRAYAERRRLAKGNTTPERLYRAAELIDILLDEYKLGVRGIAKYVGVMHYNVINWRKKRFVIKPENYEKLREAVDRLNGFVVKERGDALRYLMGEKADGENN